MTSGERPIVKRIALLVLIVGTEYVVAAGILLLALEARVEAPRILAALGAALAGLTALVGYLLGKRQGRKDRAEDEARDDRTEQAAPEPVPAPAPTPVPIPAPVSGELGAEVAYLRHFFLDIVEALPVGFATLDRRFVLRSANRALRTLLGLADGAQVAGVPLHETPLGSAIYDGSRTMMAGRPFHEIAEFAVREGALDLSPLLVPRNGEPWAARLRARLEPWPRPPATPEHFFLWAEFAGGESRPSGQSASQDIRLELERARRRLLEETLLRDALLAALPIGVVLLDEEGALLGWSDSVREILAREIALREGVPLAEAWPVFASAPHVEALRALRARGIPFVARLPVPGLPADAVAAAPGTELIVRGVPVGIPEANPRRFLLLVEERRDPAAIGSMGIGSAARARAELLATRIPEIRSRLSVLSSVAEFLGSSLPDADLEVLSAIRMISIQRDRIEGALGQISETPEATSETPESS